jgi:uncharacterized protein Yka (UPF0111/DUF47 family)
VPFERSEVLTLESGLDGVVDFAAEAPGFLDLRVEAPSEPGDRARRHPGGRRRRERRRALEARRPEEANAHLAEVDRLKDVGDRMLRERLTALFGGGWARRR